MPKFSQAGLVRADNLSLEKVNLPDITLGGKPVGYDYQKDMEAMFQAEKEKKEQHAASLVLDDINLGSVSLSINSFDVGGTWKGLSILSESEQLLEEAKRLVAQGQFQQALPLLEQALQAGPDQEAIYLKAYCLVELNRMQEALVCIASLRHANLPPMLQARLEILKERTRKAISEALFRELFLREMLGQMLGMEGAQARQAIARLQQLVDLDPEMSMYHFMLGAKLLETGYVEQALRAVNRGVREATVGDCEKLKKFQWHVEGIYLQILVQTAVRLFKRFEYRLARLELKKIDPVYHKDIRVVVLDAYFQELEHRPPARGADFPPPVGSGEIVEEVYQFLVGEEMSQARNFLGQAQIGEAETMLRQARRYAPEFVPANLELATCVYMRGRIEYMIARGNLDKDALLKRLKEIKPYASLAAKKAEEGKTLVEAIKQFMTRLDEEQRAEGVLQEFVSIMQAAQGGIRDMAHLQSIQKRMSALSQKLPGIQSRCTSKDINATLTQLSEIVTQNINNLQAMENEVRGQQHDIDLVKPLTKKYDQVIKKVQGGIDSRETLNSVQSEFESLRDEIEKARRQLQTKEGKDAVADLSKAVQARLSEINSVQAGERAQENERNLVDGLIEEFNTTMEYLSQHKIKTPSELENARRDFRDMKERAQAARRKVSSRDAKSALDQLTATIDKILKQLDG